MSIFYKFLFTTVTLTILFTSCSKDEDKEGCMDEQALNYNTLAVIDDGSCEYLDSTVTIWKNGQLGYWGNTATGAFEVKSCHTNITTIFLNPDSTFIAPDSIIDNAVTPPDTTYTPADTTITGDTYLLVNSDTNGRYKLIIQLLNQQSGADFKNGELIFNAKLHPDATIQDFEVIISGNNASSETGNCSSFRFADPINVATSSLDTNSFKKISLPMTNFNDRNMNSINLVFGIQGNNAVPNTSLIMINNVRWEARQTD